MYTYKGEKFASRKHFKGNNFKMYCVYRTFIHNKKDEYKNAKQFILEKHEYFEDFAYDLDDAGKTQKANKVFKIIDAWAFKKMHKLNNQYKHYFKRDLRNPFNFVLEIDY
jgi:hypothetical protein